MPPGELSVTDRSPLPVLHPGSMLIGVGRSDNAGALAPTIWPSTTHEIGTPEHTARIASMPRTPRFYARHGNPSVRAFEEAIAELEHAEAALAFASGMGALSCALLALCPSGSHVVAQKQMYGGTAQLLGVVAARVGITTTFVDVTVPGAFAAAVTPATTLIIAETPANPRLDLVDLDELAAISGPMKVVDATFATPIGQRTLRPGIDMVMHSATKAIAGHNDACLGVIAGSEELVNWLWGYSILLGATPSPHDATSALRGLRTLEVRFQRQSATALGLADVLAARPDVSNVRYPFHPNHPQHDLARRSLAYGGGVLTFDLVDRASASRFLAALRLCRVATSLGGPETLMTHPATTTHAGLDEDELADSGITDGTIRVSCGLESTPDVLADVVTALTHTADGT